MRKLLFLVLVITFFASCKKNDSVNKSEYLPLDSGTYWVYVHYDIDSLGNEIEKDRIDSVIISRDTIINNLQYFVLEGTNYPNNGISWGVLDILRDSSGYIVNDKGEIRFSEDNFSNILASKTEVLNEDTLYTLTYQMEILSDPINVPAGDFEVLNFKGTVTTPQQIIGVENPRFLNNLYSNNVGKVLQSYFYIHSPIISEKRLVRYNVEK